jgi:virulence factor
MSRLRIGVVGSGNIAHIAQLPTLSARDDVELSALVTRDPGVEKIMARWGFKRSFDTVSQMVSEQRLDAIFVLTPRMFHSEGVEAGLQGGVDVFCEKPLAVTADEAERLADLADKSGQLLMVGFNRRFAPVYVAAREVFGESGAQFCVAQKNRPGSEYRATFENAIHMIDLLCWFCGGEPVEVTAHSAGDDPWQEDGVGALVRFDSGNTGLLMAARQAGVWAEKLDAYGQLSSAEVVAPDRVVITRDGVSHVREMSPEAYGWATATQTFGFAAEVHHFLERVRDRAQPRTSGREAARTQRLLEKILVAAGLPTEEQPGHEWQSQAVARGKK